MIVSQCHWGVRSTNYSFQNVFCRSPSKRIQKFSLSSMLQKLGPVPKMTGVSNPELEKKLKLFREVAVLPKHLRKDQQDLVYNNKYASKLENERVIVKLHGEEFRLKHINICKDVPSIQNFIYDILPLLKSKEDWSVLPNILHGLKNAGFKIKLPIAEKLVRTAGINGRQNVILECLRRRKHTGIDLSIPRLTNNVLFWIYFKASEQDKTLQCIRKSLTMAEQVLKILGDDECVRNRHRLVNMHQLSQPEVLGIPLSIAALGSFRFKSSKDKNGLVANLASQFVSHSIQSTPPRTIGLIEQARKTQELENLVQELRKSKNNEEFTKQNKIRKTEIEALETRATSCLYWMMMNAQVVKGLKLALSIVDSSFQHRLDLQKRLVEIEKNYRDVESAWRELHAVRGRNAQDFFLSKLLKLDVSEI